jgi:hypothetical protein
MGRIIAVPVRRRSSGVASSLGRMSSASFERDATLMVLLCLLAYKLDDAFAAFGDCVDEGCVNFTRPRKFARILRSNCNVFQKIDVPRCTMPSGPSLPEFDVLVRSGQFFGSAT